MNFKTLSVASSIAILAGMSAPVYAQDNEDSGARNTEIIVTAQFREAKLQDTPIAITAVNAEMLEARGQTDISQVAAQAPNVTLKPQPQNGGSGLIAFIRGVGQVDFNYALDPGVGVYIDDVFIPTLSSSMLELMDLERIEVLRGPQGTLAGKNSIGGSIKLFSQKPKGDGSGSLRVKYGSYNRIEVRGMADFAVADNLFARVSGMSKSVGGYINVLDYGQTHSGSNVSSSGVSGANSTTQGGMNTTGARGALRWLPTDRLEINVAADFSNSKGEAGPTVLLAAGTPVTSEANFVASAAIGDGNANPATDANGNPWLVGIDGAGIPLDCRFVPSGVNSCDTLGSGYGDTRYISYANFTDNKAATSQSPYKAYTAQSNQDFTGWGINGNITFDVSDNLQLVYIGSWREYQSNWGQDQDSSPVPVAQLDNQLNHRAWSQEIRLNGEFGDGLVQYTVGGFWLDQDGEYIARVDLNYAGIDFIHGPDTTPSTTKAVFGTATLNPTDSFSLIGGLRYTKDKKTYTYFRSNPDGTLPSVCEFFLGAATAGPTGIGNNPNCLLNGIYNISDSFEGDRFDWRITGNYRFSDNFMTYASASTGFKGGGVNPRPFFGPGAGECDAAGYVAPAPCNQLQAFDPETITTYEIGFKSDLLDRRLRLNGAAFFNKYNDIILTLSACPSIPCQQPNNVGSADVKGFELEFSAFPTDGLSLDGGLSYINFEYTDVGTSGLAGTEITPYTPEWTYSFGIQYDHEMTAGTLMARFDGAYQSDVFTESFNTESSRVNGYFIGNARMGFTTADDDWNVALEVANVFDKYYFLSKSDATTSLGVITGVPGLPRTWSVSVGRKF